MAPKQKDDESSGSLDLHPCLSAPLGLAVSQSIYQMIYDTPRLKRCEGHSLVPAKMPSAIFCDDFQNDRSIDSCVSNEDASSISSEEWRDYYESFRACMEAQEYDSEEEEEAVKDLELSDLLKKQTMVNQAVGQLIERDILKLEMAKADLEHEQLKLQEKELKLNIREAKLMEREDQLEQEMKERGEVKITLADAEIQKVDLQQRELIVQTKERELEHKEAKLKRREVLLRKKDTILKFSDHHNLQLQMHKPSLSGSSKVMAFESEKPASEVDKKCVPRLESIVEAQVKRKACNQLQHPSDQQSIQKEPEKNCQMEQEPVEQKKNVAPKMSCSSSNKTKARKQKKQPKKMAPSPLTDEVVIVSSDSDCEEKFCLHVTAELSVSTEQQTNDHEKGKETTRTRKMILNGQKKLVVIRESEGGLNGHTHIQISNDVEDETSSVDNKTTTGGAKPCPPPILEQQTFLEGLSLPGSSSSEEFTLIQELTRIFEKFTSGYQQGLVKMEEVDSLEAHRAALEAKAIELKGRLLKCDKIADYLADANKSLQNAEDATVLEFLKEQLVETRENMSRVMDLVVDKTHVDGMRLRLKENNQFFTTTGQAVNKCLKSGEMDVDAAYNRFVQVKEKVEQNVKEVLKIQTSLKAHIKRIEELEAILVLHTQCYEKMLRVGKEQATTLELALTFEDLAGYMYQVVKDKFTSQQQMLAFLCAKKRSQAKAKKKGKKNVAMELKAEEIEGYEGEKSIDELLKSLGESPSDDAKKPKEKIRKNKRKKGKA